MPRLRFLSSGDIEQITSASFEVLEESGVMVKNQAALGLLQEAGCGVDNEVVRFPQELVEGSLKEAPSSIELHARDGDEHHLVGVDNVIYNPGSAAIYFIDRDTEEMRRAESLDLVQLVRLVDALEHIHA